MLRPLVVAGKIPGKVVPIAFDDHIENTGLVRLGDRTIATLIDLDDSGIGPAGLEALSIAVGLRQAGYDEKTVKKASRAFAKAATGSNAGPEKVEGPNWTKLRANWIEKHTLRARRDGKLQLSFNAGFVRPIARAYRAIERAAAVSKVLAGYRVLDIAHHVKVAGGSAGHIEYLVLAQRPSSTKLDVFLFKEQTAPGINDLGLPEPGNGERIRVLESAFWKELPEKDFFYVRKVRVPGRTAPVDFLVRDNFAFQGFLPEGSQAKREALAIRVAKLYGREHGGNFEGISAKELAHWMRESSKAIADGYEQLHRQLKKDIAATPAVVADAHSR
jgi:hypothetical protein